MEGDGGAVGGCGKSFDRFDGVGDCERDGRSVDVRLSDRAGLPSLGLEASAAIESG